MPDRPNRKEQRRARTLAARAGIGYQQALSRLRGRPPSAAEQHMVANTRLGEILTLARRESEQLGHGGYVAPEHLLLALIRSGRGPATFLSTLGVADRIGARVRQLAVVESYRPDREHTKELMRHADRYMCEYGHVQVGPDHVLAAMTHVQSGIIAQVFDELDLRARLREKLTVFLELPHEEVRRHAHR